MINLLTVLYQKLKQITQRIYGGFGLTMSDPNNNEEIIIEEVPAGENEAAGLSIEQQLAAVQQEAAKNLEGWQRALADLANARKRFEKQSQSAYANATVEVVSKLLPIMDDFERAMVNVPAEVANHSWFQGLNGVARKLNGILDGVRVERIPAVGQPFDPNVHEALSSEASQEYESGLVIKELVAGYRFEDRVIRPALVIVAD